MSEVRFGSKTVWPDDDPELKGAALALGSNACNRLLVSQDAEEGGFSVVYIYFKPFFPLLRHKHEDDCMYVVISGGARMGRKLLEPGDCFFIPAQAPYMYTAGPQGIEVLEIRHNADPEFGYTTMLTNNSATRVQEVHRAVQQHADRWAAIDAGPLLKASARAIDRPATPDPQGDR